MVEYYKFAAGLLFLVFILPMNSNSHKISVKDDKNATEVEDFQQQRFCNQSTSCSLVSKDLPQYGDLRSEHCMCDQPCSQYGDCCKDAPIYNSKSNFTCVSTYDDHIYMKTSCPSTWQGSPNVTLYCENAKSINNKLDIPLIIPVISQNNIVYRNFFCAVCNEDEISDYWNVGIWLPSNSSLDDSSVDKLTLMTDHINVITVQGIIPPDLVNQVRYCQPNVIDSCPSSLHGSTKCPEYAFYVHHGNKTFQNPECLQCNEPSLVLTNDICMPPKIEPQNKDFFLVEDSLESFLQETNFCSELQNSDLQLLCPADDMVNAVRPDPCSSPDMCEIEQFFDINDENIEFIGNDTIFLKSLQLELTNIAEAERPQWIPINESIIFVCGIKIAKNGFLSSCSSWLSDILIKLSIICLILHLVVVLQLPKLRNIPGKSLAAYSFSLLIAFVCLDLDARWGLCKFTSVILHYSLLNCFTWMLLMSYNCWQATYKATKLRQASDKKSRKFLCYTLIALFIPLVIVSLGVYLEKASRVPCNWKPGYGTGGECFIGRTESLLALFIIPASVLFVINNLFFAHTAYLIYFNQRRNTITQQDRINFKLYIRLALIMGSTWTFGSIYTFTEWSVIQILFVILNMSQGIFIFIAFTLQKRNLKMLRSKYEKNRKIAGLLTWCLGEKSVSDETTTSESLRLR